MIYAIPDFSGDFTLHSTCTGMTYMENVAWPARACIILSDGTGTSATSSEFQTYIGGDLNKNNQVITKYLNASWNTRSTGYTEAEQLGTLVLGGTYSDGQQADTKIKIHANVSYNAEVLRFKYASHMGNRYPLIIDVYINEVKVCRFEANWWDWHWQEIDIEPYDFIAGNDYILRFETKNVSPYGQGLVRLYMDQSGFPQPVWNAEINSFVAPSDSEFIHEALYEVAYTEGTDVYPDSVVIDNYTNYHYLTNTPFDGPGKAFLEILSCSSGTVTLPTQICYPFGSYYSTVTTEQKEDVHIDIKTVLNGIGITSGYAVWDDPVENLADVNLRYSEYLMPRYLIEGTAVQTQVISNLDTFTGYTVV
jgi:hypothetical protein